MFAQQPREPMDVLIIGAGMYVCGRGTSGHGTILPAVVQAQRDGLVGQIAVAATSETSIDIFNSKLAELNGLLGTRAEVVGFPKSGENPEAYKEAIQQLPARSSIIVAVPDHLHTSVASDALRAGKHVLVVKPLAPTVSEVRRLIELAKAKELYGAVEFHKRWDWPNLKLRQAISDGKLGDILYAAIEFSQRKIVPSTLFRSWADKSNIFQYLAVHYVDMISYLTGATPLRAVALGQKSWLVNQGIDTFDSVEAIIEWRMPGSPETFTSTILTNWIDPNSTSSMSYQSIKVVGTKGRFDSDQKDRGTQVITDDGGIEDINPYFTQLYPRADGQGSEYRGYGIDSVRQFLEDAHALCHGMTSPQSLEGLRPTFREALVSTAVVEAVNKSLDLGGAWVEVEKLKYSRSN